MVAYTESVSRTMIFLLFDDYDSLRLWAVSPDTCRLAQKLNLEPVRGTMENVTESMHIIEVVANTRFDTLRICWCKRGEYESGSVVRPGPGAYYQTKLDTNYTCKT